MMGYQLKLTVQQFVKPLELIKVDQFSGYRCSFKYEPNNLQLVYFTNRYFQNKRNMR